jgi:hypothetical protein
VHTVIFFLAPLLVLGFLPVKIFGICCGNALIKGTDSVDIKAVAAVFAGQLLAASAEGKACIAAGTFVFHNSVFHRHPPFFLT